MSHFNMHVWKNKV